MNFEILKNDVLRDLYTNGKTPEICERLAWISVKKEMKSLKQINPKIKLEFWLEMTKNDLLELPLSELIEQAICITREPSTSFSDAQRPAVAKRSLLSDAKVAKSRR